MKESGTGRSLRQTLFNWARPRAAVSAISLGSFFACGGSVVGKADSLDLLWQSPRGRALGGSAAGSQSPLGKRRAVKTLAWNKPRPCALKARFGRVFLFIVTASSQSGGDTGATLRWRRRSRLLMVGVPCPRTAGNAFCRQNAMPYCIPRTRASEYLPPHGFSTNCTFGCTKANLFIWYL